MKISGRSIKSLILISLIVLGGQYGLAFAIEASISEMQIRNTAEMVSDKLDRASIKVAESDVPLDVKREALLEINQAKMQLQVLQSKSAIVVKQREEAIKKKEELIAWLYGTGAVSIIAVIGHIMKFPILERRYKKLLIAEKEAALIKEGIMTPKK